MGTLNGDWIMAAVAAALLPMGASAQEAPKAATGSGLSMSVEQKRVAYRSAEKLMAYETVKRGEKVHPLPDGKPLGDVAIRVGDKTLSIDDYMAAYEVSGLLVIKDGRVILERYALGRGPQDRWTSFSVAKSVTSTLVGAAIQDGFIKSLDDPVTAYVPELKGGGYTCASSSACRQA